MENKRGDEDALCDASAVAHDTRALEGKCRSSYMYKIDKSWNSGRLLLDDVLYCRFANYSLRDGDARLGIHGCGAVFECTAIYATTVWRWWRFIWKSTIYLFGLLLVFIRRTRPPRSLYSNSCAFVRATAYVHATPPLQRSQRQLLYHAKLAPPCIDTEHTLKRVFNNAFD